MSITSFITDLGRPVAFYPAIARAFGDVNAALIVCQFMYWRGRVGEREIYKTQAEVEVETFVPPHTQRRILKKLSDMGMVTIEKKGIPATNHFLWHWDVVDAFISDYILKSQQNVTTSPNKLSPLDATNSHDQSRQIVTTITETTTETTTKETAKTKKRFSPPSVGDVRMYCIERKNRIDAEAFVDHYNSNGWMVGRSPMKDWRAAVRQWERRQSDYNRSQSAGQSPARPGSYQGVEI